MAYQPKTNKDIRCPLECGMEVFGGKWKTRVICVLHVKQPLRFNELKRELVNITDTVLNSTLKELIGYGTISRHSYDTQPPHVDYRLTELGESTIPVLTAIHDWADTNLGKRSDTDKPFCKDCNSAK